MLDELQQIVEQLEESLRVIEANAEGEALNQPELLEKMNRVALSLIEVTRALQSAERSSAMNNEIKNLLDRKAN